MGKKRELTFLSDPLAHSLKVIKIVLITLKGLSLLFANFWVTSVKHIASPFWFSLLVRKYMFKMKSMQKLEFYLQDEA